MNAPCPQPFPPNPNINQMFGGFVWNGGMWVALPSTGILMATTLFKSNGVYFPRAGLMMAVVEALGAGGGGGGAVAVIASPSDTGWMMAGGGGGAGGYSRSTLSPILLAGGVAITTGVGGSAGDFETPGGNGTATTFGVLVTANGGIGGQQGNRTQNYWGMGGGRTTPGTGDLATVGSAGMSGHCAYYDPSTADSSVQGGQGAASFYGGVGVSAAPPMPGGTGEMDGEVGWWGSGGGGGASASSANPALGGVGGFGLVAVTEFFLATGSGDCGPGGAMFDARVTTAGKGGDCGPSGHGWREHGSAGFSGDPSPYGFEE